MKKNIQFKTSEDFLKRLDDFCGRFQISKTALIKMLIIVFIKRVETNEHHFNEMLRDYRNLRQKIREEE